MRLDIEEGQRSNDLQADVKPPSMIMVRTNKEKLL
jgi:hypothetical protein